MLAYKAVNFTNLNFLIRKVTLRFWGYYFADKLNLNAQWLFKVTV